MTTTPTTAPPASRSTTTATSSTASSTLAPTAPTPHQPPVGCFPQAAAAPRAPNQGGAQLGPRLSGPGAEPVSVTANMIHTTGLATREGVPHVPHPPAGLVRVERAQALSDPPRHPGGCLPGDRWCPLDHDGPRA